MKIPFDPSDMEAEFDKTEEFLRESNAIEGVYDTYSLEQATHAWEYLMTQKEINPSVVRKTHKILMLNKPLQLDEIGYFRKCKVWVGGREGMDWKLIPLAVSNWCKRMNYIHEATEDVSKAGHVNYEIIHPFVDGNGRTGRMFMNWWRLKNGLPLLIIHEGKEQMEYYGWFK